MGEVVRFNQPYWKSFRLADGKQRWFYTDEASRVKVDKKCYNKNTTCISILKGYETEEYSAEPISKMIYYIAIDYRIANYFGDTSGMHFRSKTYMLVDDKLYKQEKGEGVEVKRMTKELKGALEELKRTVYSDDCCSYGKEKDTAEKLKKSDMEDDSFMFVGGHRRLQAGLNGALVTEEQLLQVNYGEGLNGNIDIKQ